MFRVSLLFVCAAGFLLACGPDTSSSSSSSSSTGGGSSSSSSSSGGVCTQDTWANYAQQFFVDNCSNCHHHSGQYQTVASVNASRASITSRIQSGNMPEGYSLTTSDQNRIETWLGCSPLQ